MAGAPSGAGIMRAPPPFPPTCPRGQAPAPPRTAGTRETPWRRLFPHPRGGRNGPTSVFQSVAKLPTDKITGGVLLNQKVAPAMLEKPRDREKLLLLLRTFFDVLHGFHVQYNVVSRRPYWTPRSIRKSTGI